jgi:hypothetical protein
LGVDPRIENPKPKIQNRDGLSRRQFLSTVAVADIAVESEEGRGTRFIVTLPVSLTG